MSIFTIIGWAVLALAGFAFVGFCVLFFFSCIIAVISAFLDLDRPEPDEVELWMRSREE